MPIISTSIVTSQYKIMYPGNFAGILGTDISGFANKLLEELVVNVQTAVAAGTIRSRDDTPMTVTEGALSRIPIVHRDLPTPDTSAIDTITLTVPDSIDDGIKQAYQLVKYSSKGQSPDIAIEEFVQAHIANALTDAVKQTFRNRLGDGSSKKVPAKRRPNKKK